MMKHLDDERRLVVSVRKQLIEEVMSKSLLTSRPDREAVIDAILPCVMRMVKR
jgi:hypothetical protein